MKAQLVRLFQRHLIKPALVPFYTHLYKLGLRGMGVLNAEGSAVTGEAWLFAYLKRCVPVKVICDVGANDGGTTKEILRFFPAAKAYCFEPNPETYQLLVNNTKRLPVTPFNVAVSDRPGHLKLYDFADTAPLKPTQPTATLASVYPKVIAELHRQPAKSYTVPAVSLDQWAKTHRIATIDFMNLDTEGHELAVLTGARQLLARHRIATIQLEFNEMNVYSRTFFRDILQALPGYRLFRLLPSGLWPLQDYRPLTHEIFGFQNLLALSPSLHTPGFTANQS